MLLLIVKKQSLGISVIDIAQTLQLSLSGQRFGYFMKKKTIRSHWTV
jgi:hypothetical protein